MAPIGSVIKNTLVYAIIMALSTFAVVRFWLFNGLVDLVKYAVDGDTIAGQNAINALFLSLLVLFIAHGLATNLSLPSVVGDEMIEF